VFSYSTSGAGESEVPLSPAECGAQQRRVVHEPVGAGTGGEAFPDPGASNKAGDRERRRPDHAVGRCSGLSRTGIPEVPTRSDARCRMARLSTAERNSNGSNGARDALSETPIGNTKWQCATHRSRHSALGNEPAPTEVGEGPAASEFFSPRGVRDPRAHPQPATRAGSRRTLPNRRRRSRSVRCARPACLRCCSSRGCTPRESSARGARAG